MLEIISNRLKLANLTINAEKSKFLMKKIKYLGHIMGEEGIMMDPEKIEAITNFPAPTSPSQVRRLMGMAGFYRKFIQNFSDVTAPIINLLKKDVKFCWTNEAQDAFELLKTLLSSVPVIASPKFSEPFLIRCDASTEGIGSVLFQKNDAGDERPVALFS